MSAQSPRAVVYLENALAYEVVAEYSVCAPAFCGGKRMEVHRHRDRNDRRGIVGQRDRSGGKESALARSGAGSSDRESLSQLESKGPGSLEIEHGGSSACVQKEPEIPGSGTHRNVDVVARELEAERTGKM